MSRRPNKSCNDIGKAGRHMLQGNADRTEIGGRKRRLFRKTGGKLEADGKVVTAAVGVAKASRKANRAGESCADRSKAPPVFGRAYSVAPLECTPKRIVAYIADSLGQVVHGILAVDEQPARLVQA